MGIGYMELGKNVPWERNAKEKIVQTNAMDVRDGKTVLQTSTMSAHSRCSINIYWMSRTAKSRDGVRAQLLLVGSIFSCQWY